MFNLRNKTFRKLEKIRKLLTILHLYSSCINYLTIECLRSEKKIWLDQNWLSHEVLRVM